MFSVGPLFTFYSLDPLSCCILGYLNFLCFMNLFILLCSLLVSFQMECSKLTILWDPLFFPLHLVVVLCTISTFIENTSDNIITFSFSNQVHYKEFKGRAVYYVYLIFTISVALYFL